MLVVFPTSRLLYPVTKLLNDGSTETSIRYPLTIAAPVQFDEEPAIPKRAPEFNEHGDAILADLGLDWDTIVDLKVRGVTA